MTDLEAVKGVNAVAVAGAALRVIAHVDHMVPEVHGEQRLWGQQGKYFHRHIGLLQRGGPRQDEIPASIDSGVSIPLVAST